MPWHIEKRDTEFCVIKDSDGSTEACHATRSEAQDHMAALYANEPDAGSTIARRERGARTMPATTKPKAARATKIQAADAAGPAKVQQNDAGEFCVVEADGTVGKCYPTQAEAQQAVDALNSAEGNAATKTHAADAAPAAHAYVDANGDGTCDVCGMTKAEHAAAPASSTTPEAFAAHIEERGDQYCVVGDDGSDVGCYADRAQAQDKLATLMQADSATGTTGMAFITVEGIETADGRMFELDSLKVRPVLPIPLMMQDTNPEWGGHTGAWFAGAITEVYRDERDETRWLGRFTLATGDNGARAEDLIRSGLRGVSVDASYDNVTFDIRKVDEDGWPVDVLARFQSGTIMGATITPFPAFEQTLLWLDDEDEPEIVAATKGTLIPMTAEPEIVPTEGEGLLLLASGGPSEPPSDWFVNPGLDGPTALSVTGEGRIAGHIATWRTCHIGHASCVTAPISPSNYAFFHTGEIVAAGGTRIPVGTLTLGTGHAPTAGTDARGAMAHYDDTGTAVADIRCGEDEHGIWAAGAVRPGISDADIRALCAAAPSGDWRRINGSLELVAVLCVNVPGFPVPRTQAQVASGAEVALVAAPGPGVMSWPAQQDGHQPDERVVKLERRLAILEAHMLPELHAAALARLEALTVDQVDAIEQAGSKALAEVRAARARAREEQLALPNVETMPVPHKPALAQSRSLDQIRRRRAAARIGRQLMQAYDDEVMEETVDGSYEDLVELIEEAAEAVYGEDEICVVATFPDHVVIWVDPANGTEERYWDHPYIADIANDVVTLGPATETDVSLVVGPESSETEAAPPAPASATAG